MKRVNSITGIIIFVLFMAIQCTGQNKQTNVTMQTRETTNLGNEGVSNFHDFTVKDIEGNDVSLASFKGKKVLVVNVASKCGLTPQYEELQTLYQRYKDQNFVVIGFPANNFNEQEPGSNMDIKEFCEVNYGVTFPMMAKISVAGEDQSPVYQWLTQKSENGVLDQEVTWNFQKYMVDEEGRLVDVVLPRESPLSEKIVDWITGG